MDRVQSLLQHYADVFKNNQMVLVPISVIVYDIARRLFPTKNPAGFMQDVSKVLKGIKAIFSVLANLVGELACFIDKIVPLPQNLKEANVIVVENQEEKK
jgi:hypothetical protein